GILFGAVTVYVGLRAGLTVAASIPIAVLSISLLRAVGRLLPPFGRGTILENNIVQTTGSAGRSRARWRHLTPPGVDLLRVRDGLLAGLPASADRRMARRLLHDPATPSVDRQGTRQSSVSRRHRLRGCADRRR